MKLFALVLLFLVSYVQCRKTYAPINKNANIDFINMEGGGVKPAAKPVPPTAAPVPSVPKQAPPSPTPKPNVTSKPVAPVTPVTNPPNIIKPKPVNPAPVANPITTPGPGSVKQLVNFYDSQGKASPIRPYSYSQAVKQG